MAEQLVEQELLAITQSGKIQNGILNPSDLGDNQRRLLDKYLEYKVRQESVCVFIYGTSVHQNACMPWMWNGTWSFHSLTDLVTILLTLRR